MMKDFKEKFELFITTRVETNQSNLYKTVYDIIEKVKKERRFRHLRNSFKISIKSNLIKLKSYIFQKIF